MKKSIYSILVNWSVGLISISGFSNLHIIMFLILNLSTSLTTYGKHKNVLLSGQGNAYTVLNGAEL